MAWLLSKKLIEDCANSRFSQEQAAAFLADTFSAGEQCALWNGTPTQRPSWLPAKTTAACRLSRSGMMFKHLTDDLGKAVLTWCREASHAKTYHAPEKEPELLASEAECGNTWRELSAKFDPVSHSWKTHQCLWEEDLAPSSLTLPRWGMMRGGVLWEQMTQEHRIEENESGFWPTPCLPGNGGSGGKRKLKAMLWPTPTKSDGMGGPGTSEKRMGGENLRTVVKIWPTPTAHNAKETSAPSESFRNTPTLAAQAGGQLNPTWVEWLMGWPRNWTSLAKMENRAFDLWHDSFIWKKSGSTIDPHNDALRNVWWRIDPATAPQGWESIKQLTEQFSGALPEVPHCGSHGDIRLGAREGEARDVQNMPLPIQAEASTKEQDLPKTRVPQGEWYSVGRVALGIVARADRLRCLGNGQVPSVVRLAWGTLTT